MAELSLDTALEIVRQTLITGRATECAPLTVAVLDAGGHLKAFSREDGSGILRPQICFGKAWGALGVGAGSRVMAQRAAQGAGDQAFVESLGALSGGRFVPAPGGVLVRDSGSAVIGAVGVTGDVSEKDEACAIAGIEAVGLVADPG